MRINYLFLTVLMVAALSACQQEETSVATVAQPEAITSSQQVTAPATETVTEVAKGMVEEASKELAAIEKANANKAVMKEPVKAAVTPASPVVPKPVAGSPAVAEKAREATKVVEEIKPTVVIDKASGDPLQGAKVARKCAACHTFEQGGKNKTGPNLFAVFGRTKGATPGFKYGSYLNAQNAAGEVWDEVSLRAWNADSKAAAKAGGESTKMPAQRITGTKADDLIAYLKSLK